MKPALWLGLALACGGALAVSWLPDGEITAPRTRDTGRTTASESPSEPVLVRHFPVVAAETGQLATVPLLRDAWPGLAAGALAAWSPPEKPAAPPLPTLPPAPPPPFPYQWLGQLQDGAQTRLFLAGAQQTLAVAPGDAVDQNWRVEGGEAGRLRLTWLPSGATVYVSPR